MSTNLPLSTACNLRLSSRQLKGFQVPHMLPRHSLSVLAIVSCFALLRAQTVSSTPKREHFQNASVLFGWAQDSRGERVRTFITRPNNASGRVPAIFFVG